MSSFVILALVYAASVSAALRRADASVTAEVTEIQQLYEERGYQGAYRYLVQRSVGGGEFFYMLLDPNGQQLVGNIYGLPEAPTDPQGRVRFTYDRQPVEGVNDRAEEAATPAARSSSWATGISSLSASTWKKKAASSPTPSTRF